MSERFDISDRLHQVLTVHGLSSRTDYMPLVSDLIAWAADCCRQTRELEAERAVVARSAAPAEPEKQT